MVFFLYVYFLLASRGWYPKNIYQNLNYLKSLCHSKSAFPATIKSQCRKTIITVNIQRKKLLTQTLGARFR